MKPDPSPTRRDWFHSVRSFLRLGIAGACLIGFFVSQSTSVASEPATASSGFLGSLTEEERAWLRAHPVIRVFQDPDWPPIEFADKRGNPTGMTKDYLSCIEQRLGRKFEPVLRLSFQEALASMKRGEIDMTTSVAETPERLEFLAFTQPYMNIPIVIATQQDVTYVSNLRELKGKKVAVVDGYAVQEWMENDFPEVRLLKVKKSLDGLQRLDRGEIDAFIDSLVTIGHHQVRRDVWNVKIAGATPYFNAQRMAVRKDWAPLAGILQKALDSISVAEREEIFRRWLPLRYEQGFNYTLLWQALGGFAVIVLGLGYWNRKLSLEIRQRKQAQAALQQSDADFRTLTEAMPQIVWTARADGSSTYVNQQWVDYTGMSLDDSHGRGWNKPFHPDDQQRAWNAWNNAVTCKGIYALECRLRRADGVYRWWLLRGVPVLTGDGEVKKWVGTCTDIHDLKQAEGELRKSEERYRVITDHSPAGIFQTDVRGDCTYVNPRWTEIAGLTLGEALGKGWSQTLHPEDKQRVFDGWYEAAHAGTSYDWECRFVTKQGKQSWTTGHAEILYDEQGNSQGHLGVLVDITTRKQAEEDIRLAEARFRDIIEASPIPFALNEAEQSITYLNSAFIRTFGYDRKDIPTVDAWWSKAYPDETYRQEVTKEWLLHLTMAKHDAQPFEPMEVRIRCKDGGERTVLVTATPLASSLNDLLVVTFYDITERKKTESLLHEQLDELQRWQQAMVGREGRIISMKQEVNELLARSGQPPRYADHLPVEPGQGDA